tara:strand:- start:73 stop:870 length:798 start_codon:yes stop_codon:yes gene_type:complete
MNNNFANEIKENGIIKIKNFLSPVELIKLSNIINFYKAPKGDIESIFLTNLKVLSIKLFKFKFRSLLHTYELAKFKKNKKLDQIAKDFFNKQVNSNYIDGYYSKAGNKDILPWHTDQSYSGSKTSDAKFYNPDNFYLKFFIYLTNVASNNGCMSYIPKTHKIAYEIRKGIYNKEISYQPYWSLKDFRNIVKNNINFLHNKMDSEIIENFLKNSEFEDSMNATNKYDYNATAGTMIIFDEGGIHRGSKPSLNDRMVIRYLIKPSSN